jgi:SulP family sulfate permease
MDTSGLDALEQLYSALSKRDIALVLASVNPQPLGLIRRSGFEAHIGADNIVPSVDDLAESDIMPTQASPAPTSPSAPATAG